MAAPNIVSVSSIIGESQGFQLGTTTTTALITVASNKLVKINRISVANIDGTNAADASVAITKASGSPIMIASTVSVPADATLVVVDKNTVFKPNDGL